MQSSDTQVLEQALAWLSAGQPVWLVTVLATWGSAPRPAGSLLALSGDGHICGSVSGGCIEADLLQRVRQARPDAPERLSYGVSSEEARRFGLPCGGRLELLLECLRHDDTLVQLVQALRDRRLLRREVRLPGGQVELRPAAEAAALFEWDAERGRLGKVFGPVWQLLLVGAGQIAHYLAEMAQALDYRVLICDPREEYAAAWRVPGTEWLRGMPDDVVREWIRDARSAAVTLAHDPRLDDMALMEALVSPAFYVGALGSRKSHAQRRQRLADLGLGAAHIERLRGPVGLPIGSRTPAEIAVSILAELTAARHGVLADARAALGMRIQ